MSDSALLELARRAGLAPEWTDATGRSRQVGADTLRCVLTALGFSSATPADIASSLDRLGGERTPDRLPALITMQVGSRLTLPAGALGSAVHSNGELVHEDGTIRPVRLSAGRRGALGPVVDRIGYHCLRLGNREIGLAVAPARCVTLEERGGGKRMWGVAAQIYGLRRAGDGGIGDATAVRFLAEAAARRGADAVALSPAHGLFAADLGRYGPYSPSSRLFLNPLFADPAVVFGTARVASLGHDASILESAPLIEWQAAAAAKFALLRHLFDDFRVRDVANATPLAAEFAGFVAEGGSLLRDHALFEALHGKWSKEPGGANWRNWPQGWRHPADTAIADYLGGQAVSIQYHQFLQWLTVRSFAAAQSAAREAGMRIGLISDLAIGMDHGGSHAWSRQGDLLAGLSVGAPPDAFNRLGQNWGLAAFSPPALAANGFEPFLATLRAAMKQAGGVRIDHILGLQRLWLVPEGASPSEGVYVSYPLTDLLRLLALESTRHDVVVIGEDLGTVPTGFRRHMRRVGIAGMDVLWFQRSRANFLPPLRWRSDAVAMTTTHDLPTAAGWWRGSDIVVRRELGLAAEGEGEARRSERRQLWRACLRAGVAEGKPPAPEDPQPAVDASLSFVAGTRSPLMLAPVEDLLGLADQPNVPGTTDEHPNWRRRLTSAASALFDHPHAARRADLIARRRSARLPDASR